MVDNELALTGERPALICFFPSMIGLTLLDDPKRSVVYISQLSRDSIFQGKLELGDVLVSVNGKSVTDCAGAKKLIDSAGPQVQLHVRRGLKLLHFGAEQAASGKPPTPETEANIVTSISSWFKSTFDNSSSKDEPPTSNNAFASLSSMFSEKGAVGLQLEERRNSLVFIAGIAPGSAADRHPNLRVGDQILSVDDVEVRGLEHAMGLIGGKKGTTTVINVTGWLGRRSCSLIRGDKSIESTLSPKQNKTKNQAQNSSSDAGGELLIFFSDRTDEKTDRRPEAEEQGTPLSALKDFLKIGENPPRPASERGTLAPPIETADRPKSESFLESIFSKSSSEASGAAGADTGRGRDARGGDPGEGGERLNLKSVLAPLVKPFEVTIEKIIPKIGTCGLCIAEQRHIVVVTQLVRDGPAAESRQIQVGDRLVGVDGAKVDDLEHAKRLLSGFAGLSVELELRRGQSKSYLVTLKRIPKQDYEL